MLRSMQYWTGTLCTAPVGSRTTHSPPDAATIRSIIAGPKNHAANTSQTVVAAPHFDRRSRAVIPILRPLKVIGVDDGYVSHSAKNAADVHPHARLMKTVLRTLPLRAK